MAAASEATAVAIEQNGVEDETSSLSSSSSEVEQPLDVTKGDEEREMDVKKEELLKVLKIGKILNRTTMICHSWFKRLRDRKNCSDGIA